MRRRVVFTQLVRPRPSSALVAALLVAWLLLAAAVAAPLPQDAPPTEAAAEAEAEAAAAPAAEASADVIPTGDDAGALADAAVEEWLASTPVSLTDLARLSTEDMCAALPALVLAPPPPAGTRVNLDDRRPLASDDPDARRYTYSAVRPGDRLDVVQVDLARDGDAWRVTSVGFRVDRAATGRAWLASPAAGAAFLAVSLLTLLLLLRPSPLRRGLARALTYVREHRRLVIVTMVLLYAAFGLGMLSGAALPPACEDAVMVVLNQALGQVGATSAVAAGDPLRLAVTIFYQNFAVVTLILYWLGLLFGLPAYLLALPQFFANGLPFGLLFDASDPVTLLATLVLIALELTAYFLVVAGGGMLLVTILRQGFAGFPLAVSKTTHMLLVAGLLLLVGAWYEVGLLLAF